MEAILENPIKKRRDIKKNLGVERIAMSYERYDKFEPKNGIKYEWKNGFVIKNGTVIKNTERYIILNIQEKFSKSSGYEQGIRSLSETRCNLNSFIIRIPYLAFFTKEQIKQSAENQHPIPSFVIEIISKNENTYETETKVQEYFEAGVETIWHIFPTLKQVWVFKNNKNVTINTRTDSCTAIINLTEFSMTVEEVFEL